MRILDNIVNTRPNSPGVVILDKLINDLKAKLPFLKKDTEESDEFEEETSSHDDDETGATDVSEVDLDDIEEESGDSSLLHKLKSKIQLLQQKPGKEKSPAPGDDKKKKIIYAVIGLGLIVILFSDEIFPPEPEVPATPSFVRPERKKVTPPAETSEATDVPATETPVETPTEETPTEETPVEATPTESLPETITETPTETMPEDTIETLPSESIEPVESIEPSIGEDSVDEAPVEDMTSSDITPMQDFTPSEDSIDGEDVSSGGNLTDQILQDLEKQAKSSQISEAKKEYVAPPDYEYRGRGLVYNCAGKHWACVDAPSYKTCEENSSSTRFLNKPNECYPFNVYESLKGCELMQNRMVSSSAKTEFCND